MSITNKNYSLEEQSAFLDIPTKSLTDEEKQAIVNAGFDLDENNSDFDTVNLPLIWCKKYLSKETIKNSNFDFDYDDFNGRLLNLLSPYGKYLMRINNNETKLFQIVTFDDIYNRFCENEEWLIASDYFTAEFREYSEEKEWRKIAVTRVNDKQSKNVDDKRALDVFIDVRLQAMMA